MTQRTYYAMTIRHWHVPDYLLLGWMVSLPQNLHFWTTIMIWPCSCKVRVKKGDWH